jgi:hypothetical protein
MAYSSPRPTLPDPALKMQATPAKIKNATTPKRSLSSAARSSLKVERRGVSIMNV